MSSAQVCLAIAFAAGVSGCADVEIDAEEDALTALSVKLTGSGTALVVNDAPRLVSGAEGNLACKERFAVDGRVRLSCERGSEFLEVIVADGKAVLVDRPAGRMSRKQSFYACTPSGKRSDGLPKKLDCKLAKPKTGGGGLSSPLPSDAPGIGIPNAHAVGSSGKLLRSMAPRSEQDFDDLLAAKVAAVLVFKNQTGTGHDVQDELDTLAARGLAKQNLMNIPFNWQSVGTFSEACGQTLSALQFVAKNLAANRRTLFHCTVGEDRTGYLAAMHRLITEPNLAPADAWDREMCERGYGAGNPLKPAMVVNTLDGSIGPLFRKMSWLVSSGKLTKKLDASVCAKDPTKDPSFAADALPASRLSCGTSTHFVP